MKKYLPFFTLLFILMACSLQAPRTPTMSPSAIPPTSTSLPTAAPPTPTLPRPTAISTMSPTATPFTSCTLMAREDSPIYQRPSTAAEVFSTFTSGDSVEPTVKTADGFYGFDPGVAQAGNVGVFRYRWILKTYQVSTDGDCAGLPVVVGPIANLCYAMVMSDTSVYADSDAGSTELTALHSGDYTMVISSTSDWVKVDLNVSNFGYDSIGWIKLENIGYNGNCETGP